MANIIAAWKAAKEGQRIQRKEGTYISLKSEVTKYTLYKHGSFSDFVMPLFDKDIMADDWEVVKTKKTVTGNLFDDTPEASSKHKIRLVVFNEYIPSNATITAEWEE